MEEEKSFIVLNTELEDRSFFRISDIIAYVTAKNATEAHLEVYNHYKQYEENRVEGRHWIVSMDDIVDFTDSIITIRDEAELSSTYVIKK